MSLRLDMLRVARSAPSLLRETADGVVGFLHRQFNGDGGARDRAGRSDLYYTVFALDGLTALNAGLPIEACAGYLRHFGDGAELDFVHRTCLARCWAALPADALAPEAASRILAGIESYRSRDGGYAPKRNADHGTVYDGFLALGAYEDLRRELPNTLGLAECVSRLGTPGGAYGNERGLLLGTTPTTAAAVVLLRELGGPVAEGAGDWLLACCHEQGGFRAVPHTPIPDLLSTATALHALSVLGVSVAAIREKCLRFVRSLWTGQAFRGHRADDVEDPEYTFYALLALGHLHP